MCGVAGIYGAPDLADRIDAMLAAIAHRGPDAEGRYEGNKPPGTVLGHQRLSIIDPTSISDQPFVADGLVLSYNGEIYNYRDIRSELEAAGVRFRTHSDTEVVLKAWRRWGAACLTRFRGMFAFAIYDEQTGELYLVRDPLGIKPMFFARHNGGVVFGSEIKAIRAALPDTAIDFSGVVASLMYYWLPDTYSAFRGVQKLPAGHWARVSPLGEMEVRQYWDPVAELLDNQGPEPTVAELRDVLESSIRAHMVSDVPVATFLSGGLDSSLVTAVACAEDPTIEAYTITFRKEDQRFEAMPDDAAYARTLAKQLGITLHEIEITPDVVEMLPRMVGVLDEPIGDPAAINTVLICEASRQAGVKVMLSGMGADEMFGGYRKHLAGLIAARYRKLPGLARRGLIEPAVAWLPAATARRGFRSVRFAKRFSSFASLEEAASFQRSYALFGEVELKRLVAPDLRPFVDDLLEEHRDVYWRGPADDHVNRMCFTDTQLFLTGLNLTYTDRASMAASTEVRVPFVDTVVAKSAFAIPGARKIEGRTSKAVLKAAARGWVPDAIIERPKGLFSAPLRSWIRRDLSSMVDEVLLGGELIGTGIIDGESVRGLVNADRRGVEDKSKEIWQLLTLELWYRQATSLQTMPSGISS